MQQFEYTRVCLRVGRIARERETRFEKSYVDDVALQTTVVSDWLLLGFCIFAQKFQPIRDTLRMPVLATLSARPFLGSNLDCHFRREEWVGIISQSSTSGDLPQFSTILSSLSNLCDRMLHGDWYREKTFPCNSQRAFIKSQEIY